MSKTINEKISTTLRITLGVCFILSGVMKAVNVYSFAQEIRLYIEAYMDSFCVQWTVETATVICAIETITGLLALRKKHEPIVAFVFLAMMSFFVWLTGMNLFSPSLMGSIESCGCFGELIHFSPLSSFVKSVVLWIMALGCWVLGVRCWKTGDRCWVLGVRCWIKRFVSDWKMYAICIAGVLPSVYSYFCFENMEHGYYVAGYIALCAFCGGWCLWIMRKRLRSKDKGPRSENL